MEAGKKKETEKNEKRKIPKLYVMTLQQQLC